MQLLSPRGIFQTAVLIFHKSKYKIQNQINQKSHLRQNPLSKNMKIWQFKRNYSKYKFSFKFYSLF